LRKQSDKEVTNIIERRRRAFKSRLVEVVGRLHQTWAANQPEIAASEKGPEAPADFDPWKEWTWHPQFPLEDLDLPAVLAVAKQVDAAPAHVSKKRKLGFRRGLVSTDAQNPEDAEGGDPEVAALLKNLSQQYGVALGGRSSSSPDPPGTEDVAQGGEDAGEATPSDVPRPPKQLKKVPKCESTKSFDSVEMLDHLKTGLGSLGQVVHTEYMAVRQAQFMAPEAQFSAGVNTILGTKGLVADQLFTHQVRREC
jgi:hypothetical protein